MADRTRWGLVAGGVLALAFLIRLGVVLHSSGGPSGVFGYDAGVYYAAADALTHGRLPYRDFVLLHPPGLMLALTPFAVLGRLTTDHTGFVVGNTAFALLGSVNAALVVQVGRRMGLPIVAGAIGGLFYAVWFGAVHAEISTRLEPLGSFAFLCGLLLLLRRPEPTRRGLVLAGAAFGAASCVKIWWIVPLIVVLAWQLRPAAPRRQVMPLAIGALASIAVIDGPFFAAAPGTMWRMVVLDQLRRNASHGSPIGRFDELSTVQFAFPNLSPAAEAIALLATALLAGALVVAAWRSANGRLLVLVAMAQVIVLFSAPSYFPFYSGYLAAPLSLVVAAAAHGARRPWPVRRFASAAAGGSVALAATLTAVAIFARPDVLSEPFPGTTLAEGVENVRCVMTDSPIALIELDALSNDLAHNCPNWVDVTGRTYDADAPPPGPVVARAHNAKYQADLRRYLFSGQAAIVIRAGTGLSPATRRTLDRLPVLESSGGFRVYRVPAGDPSR